MIRLITGVTDDKSQTMLSNLEFYQKSRDNKDHREMMIRLITGVTDDKLQTKGSKLEFYQ